MRPLPFIHSSISALLLKPVMRTGSTPGHSARMFQSSSAFRTGLKTTFAFAMRCYAAIRTEVKGTNGPKLAFSVSRVRLFAGVTGAA